MSQTTAPAAAPPISLVKTERGKGTDRRGAQSLATTKAIADTLHAFEEAIGGRATLVAALTVTDLTPEIHGVLALLGDPQYHPLSLAEICDRAKLTPAHIIRAYKAATLNRAQAIAIAHVAAAIPAVVSDIVRTAQPYDGICPRCDGRTTITLEPKATRRNPTPAPTTIPCYRCAGAGTIRMAALESQQDRVLQLAQLVTKGPALTVNTQINTPGSAGSIGQGSLAQLQLAVSDFMGSRSDAAAPPEGSAVPPPTPPAAAPVVDAQILAEAGPCPAIP